MEVLTLILCLVSVLVGLIYLYLTWNFDYWSKRGVKGPKPALIYGNAPGFIKQARNFVFELQDLYEEYKKTDEKFIGIFMTRNPQIFVIDPQLAREISVTKFQAFKRNDQETWINKNVEEVASRNPVFNSGPEWKSLRNDVIGGLSPQRLKKAYPIVMEICKKMTSLVHASSQQSDRKIEVKSLCYKYTSEIMADFIWGINGGALDIDESSPKQILTMSRKFLDLSFGDSAIYFSSGLAPQFLRKFIRRRLYPLETDNFFTQIQKEALEMRMRNRNDRADFLNHLIQLQEKKNISHMDMVGLSATVLLDGFETSATIMAHALYYLTINQDAQQKLREEIMAKMNVDHLSYDELVELPYLEQCLNETIRIVTVLTFTSRICTEETYLENRKNHKVKIEPGMTVNVSTYCFHHDSDVYPEPEKFIPERFDNGRAKELNQKGFFFPFGDGPRHCVGMKLAQLEMKAGIVEIIKNFYLKKTEEREINIDSSSFFIGILGDIFVEFEPINK